MLLLSIVSFSQSSTLTELGEGNKVIGKTYVGDNEPTVRTENRYWSLTKTDKKIYLYANDEVSSWTYYAVDMNRTQQGKLERVYHFVLTEEQSNDGVSSMSLHHVENIDEDGDLLLLGMFYDTTPKKSYFVFFEK